MRKNSKSLSFQNDEQSSERDEKYFKQKCKSKYERIQIKGEWNALQNAKYIAFLDYFKTQIKLRQDRKNFQIYKKMSEFIKTKSLYQCRSHHQKLQARYIFSNRIIVHYKQNNQLTLYQESISQLKNQFENKIEKNETKTKKDIGTQTDIYGVQKQFINCQLSHNLDLNSSNYINDMINNNFYRFPFFFFCQNCY